VNLNCKRLQCDEIWSVVGTKEKNCSAEMKARGNLIQTDPLPPHSSASGERTL